MKALIVHPGPMYSVKDVHDGWIEGLQANGVDARSGYLELWLQIFTRVAIKKGKGRGRWTSVFPYEQACRMAFRQVAADCLFWRPELIVITSGFFVPPDLIAALRARRESHLVLHCTESPYEDDRQIMQAPAFDTVLLNDPTNLDKFRAVNPRTWYMPHGWRPGIHEPGPGKPELACDVSFVGTGYPSRIEFLEKVDWQGLDLRLGGNWVKLTDDSPLCPAVIHPLEECFENTETVDLYNSSKLSLNLYRKEVSSMDALAVDQGIATGPREIELAATETFFLREPRPESDELFDFLPTFDDPADLGDLCRWWVAPERDDQRRDLARRARAAVADRVYSELARTLLGLTER